MNHPDAEAARTSISKFSENSDKGASETGLLFEVSPVFAGASAVVRDILLCDLRECRLSRDEVAVRLARGLGRPITTAQIDAFVSQSKPHRFPAELIPAWVSVTGSKRILDALAGLSGLSIATQEEREFAALGRAGLKREKLSQKLWERA